ncbi:MAG: hypothetical protein DCF15_13620 [Phormidesmis priestleyi]|uniref:Uncharacterized protein n=1 Tax=Phormidesmis priestleyi TaxID=268141 RepID=A0A2W4Z2V4_9CYAN|nr:MAG: hypothetical protein DCF15_13620 [Phormidesmis priestleyi]
MWLTLNNRKIVSYLILIPIENLGYLVAAKKLRSDVSELRHEAAERPDFWPSQLPIVKMAPFDKSLCTMRALKVSLRWKRRRKSLLTCDCPQLWDLGNDYLLYFEKIAYSDGPVYEASVSGYLIKKVDFITAVLAA